MMTPSLTYSTLTPFYPILHTHNEGVDLDAIIRTEEDGQAVHWTNHLMDLVICCKAHDHGLDPLMVLDMIKVVQCTEGNIPRPQFDSDHNKLLINYDGKHFVLGFSPKSVYARRVAELADEKDVVVSK